MNRIARVLLRMLGIGRPVPKTRVAVWSRRAEKLVALVALAYLALQTYPQPLFAHSLTKDGITFYSRGPLGGRAGERIAQARGGVELGGFAVSSLVCAVIRVRCWSSVGVTPTRQLGRSSR